MFRFDTNGQTTFTLAMNTGPGQGGFLEDLAVGRVAGVAKILRGNTSCSLAGD